LFKLHNYLDLFNNKEDIFLANADGIRLFSDESVELLLKTVAYEIEEEEGKTREVTVGETLPDGSEQRLKNAWKEKVENV